MPEHHSASRIGLYRSVLTGTEHRRSITVAREHILQDTMEILQGEVGRRPKHHFLFIAPRGFGKTHLLSLIEDAITSDDRLQQAWHVVRFPEEANRVLSFGDFLLGICENLRDSLPCEPTWKELYQRLSVEEDDQLIVDTLVPAIRQRHHSHHQSLILMVENLNQIFEKQFRDPRHAAALRGFLMEDNGCLLMATAPLQFGSVTDHKQPFYDFFDVQYLDQLSEQQCAELIRRNLEWEQREDLLQNFSALKPKLRALYRMTGGSPRLTHMLYELIAHESVSEVKQQFQLLLDRITPFYQDRLNDLGAQERALLETMAAMRDQQKTPTAIAARLRMNVTQTSTLLKRLSKAQYLKSTQHPDDKRSRLYAIREGFFDIWLTMNISRVAQQRMPFLLQFFEQFYPSLEDRNRKREEYRKRLKSGEFDVVVDPSRDANVLEALDYLSEVGGPDEQATEKLRLAGLHVTRDDPQRAKQYLHEFRTLPLDPLGQWFASRADSDSDLNYLNDLEELIAAWDSYRTGDLEAFAKHLQETGENLTYANWSEAKIAFLREHLQLVSEPAARIGTRLKLGFFLNTLARWNESECELREALQEALELADQELLSEALNNLATLLQATNRLSEAELLYRRALAINEQSYGPDHPTVATDLNNLAELLRATNRHSEAEPLYRRALAINEQSYGPDHPSVATTLNNLALLLYSTNRLSEAEPLSRRMVEIFVQCTVSTGHPHPHLETVLANHIGLLQALNVDESEIVARISELKKPLNPS